MNYHVQGIVARDAGSSERVVHADSNVVAQSRQKVRAPDVAKEAQRYTTAHTRALEPINRSKRRGGGPTQ